MHRTRRRTLLATIGGPAYRGPARRDDAGGSGSSTGSGSTEGGSGSTGDTDGDDGQGDKGTQGDGTGSKPNIDGDLDKDRAARAIAAAREGERKAKDAAKAANDRTAAILKAAGLTADGKEDPEQALKDAAEKADKATTALRDKSLRLAVRENADKAGVDATAVIDSSSFRDTVKELDSEAADYDDQVVAAMKKALKANPRLAAGAAGTTRQGGDHTGGTGGKSRSGSLEEALKRKLGT